MEKKPYSKPLAEVHTMTLATSVNATSSLPRKDDEVETGFIKNLDIDVEEGLDFLDLPF